MIIVLITSTQSVDRTVSSFVDSSAQHRGNEAEPNTEYNTSLYYNTVFALC